MIVWLASYPRSGNTFLRIILHQMYGIKTYSIYNDPTLEEIGAASTVGHEVLLASIEDLAKDSALYFIKTHQKIPPDNSPAIYLVRDGRDSLVSHAKYLHVFSSQTNAPIRRLKQLIGWENYHRTLKNVILYSGWSNHVFEWTRSRKEGLTFIIRYEDLIEDPQALASKALGQLKFEPKFSNTNDFLDFSELQQKWPGFFRKGKVGSWQEEMPNDLQNLFWKYHSEAMELLGYQ